MNYGFPYFPKSVLHFWLLLAPVIANQHLKRDGVYLKPYKRSFLIEKKSNFGLKTNQSKKKKPLKIKRSKPMPEFNVFLYTTSMKQENVTFQEEKGDTWCKRQE